MQHPSRRAIVAAAASAAALAAVTGLVLLFNEGSLPVDALAASPWGWAVPIGSLLVIFGAVALLWRFGRTQPEVGPSERAECPSCGNATLSAWKMCPHCGRVLGVAEDGGDPEARSDPSAATR